MKEERIKKELDRVEIEIVYIKNYLKDIDEPCHAESYASGRLAELEKMKDFLEKF